MKISTERPPNYELLLQVFPEIPELRPIFCFGEVIHNPFNVDVTEDLIVHESVHAIQQGGDSYSWWERYLIDPGFRLEQEVEAYREQYRFVSKHLRDREKVNAFLNRYAMALSSALYGNLCTHSEARVLIRGIIK